MGLRSVQNIVFHQIMEIRDRKGLLDHLGHSLGTKVQESRKRNKQKKSIKAIKCLFLQKSQRKQKSCNSHCTLSCTVVKTDIQKEKRIWSFL